MEHINLIEEHKAQEGVTNPRSRISIRNISGIFKNGPLDMIPFEVVKRRFHLSQKVNGRLQEIELHRIRGSARRYKDFTAAFLPRQKYLKKRWQRVHTVLGTLPIEVFQTGDAYFIIEGSYRVSTAHQVGMSTIPAYVTEYNTPAGLSAEEGLSEALLDAEYYAFLKKTKIDRLRPELEVILTIPGNYQKLEWLIEIFYEALKVRYEEEVAYIDAVLLWFDLFYAPAVNEIENSGALARFPQRTAADLLIWMWKHHKDLTRAYLIPRQ